jgi:tetratricopeptide (TPR) repeat protein
MSFLFFAGTNHHTMKNYFYLTAIALLAVGCATQDAALSESEVEAFVIEHITSQVGFEDAIQSYKSGLSSESMYFHPNMDSPANVNLDDVAAEWFYEDSITVDVMELNVKGPVASVMGIVHFHNFSFTGDRYFHGTVVKDGDSYRWHRWFHVDGGMLAKNGFEVTSEVEGAEDLCYSMLYHTVQGDVDKASAISDSLLEMDPSMAMAGYGNMWKAWFMSDGEEWDRLIAQGLAQADDEDPAIAYLLKSLSSVNGDRLQNAQMAHSLAPDSPVTQVNLAWVLMASDLSDEAKIVLDQATKRWSAIGGTFNMLGYWYMDADNMEKALDCFNMYVRLAPDVANAYDSRGDYYVKLGDTAAAKENFLKAIELSSIVKSSQEKLDKLEEES